MHSHVWWNVVFEILLQYIYWILAAQNYILETLNPLWAMLKNISSSVWYNSVNTIALSMKKTSPGLVKGRQFMRECLCIV